MIGSRRLLFGIFAALLMFSPGGRAADTDTLYQNFLNPPHSCRPLVWWHWMDGNITKDGIRKDLLWMDRAGIAGFHAFDAGTSSPQIVKERLPYMSEGWKDAFRYALDLADSLGMEVTMTSSPGWSITGGPWVTQEDAQKKLTWQEMVIEGGREYCGTLPEPYTDPGIFQGEGYAYGKYFPDGKANAPYGFYRDISVIAIPFREEDTARIVEFRTKTGWVMNYRVSDHYPTPEPVWCPAEEEVVDLTDKYADGILKWDVPAGRWKILRFGYNLIGHVNGPATMEATGLEVDKLSGDAVRRYYSNYLKMYGAASGERLGRTIKSIMIDSYESGRGTWTPRMEEEFLSRRGYSLRPWMPVLTGQIVGSAAQSERFLFDWRKTLGELMAENHYDIVNEILAPFGMKRYSEAHEERTAFVGDGMMMKRNADYPMSAFWARYRAGWHSTYPPAEADLRESSSVAHLYGREYCAAESFTTNGRIGKWDGFGAYQCGPFNLKPLADAAMAEGLTRFVIHSTVHQPCDDVFPGLGLGTYGQWFNRHETWAQEARPWTDYLSRSCYMLRQGRWVADIAYFYGEDKNITSRFYDGRVDIPSGYNYDFVNADVMLNVLRPEDGSLVTDSGMKYRVLVLDNEIKYMSLPVLRRIAEFVRSGVTVIGNAPSARGGMEGTDEEFRSLVDEVWSCRNVISGMSLSYAMQRVGMAPDVEVVQAGDADVRFVHRSLNGVELYWVANISSSPRQIKVSLRCSGFIPEVWNAVDCSITEAIFEIKDGRTVVTLDMDQDDARFIVLRKPALSMSGGVPMPRKKLVTTVSGPWKVSFQEGRGAPASVTMPELVSLSESDVEGIKYFSGTTVYSAVVFLSAEQVSYVKYLDLGEVHHLARVKVNGADLGVVWKAPYMVDVSDAFRKGRNIVEIEVTDSWANRLIGDQSKPVEERLTFTATQFYEPGDEPVPSGLVGPVRLLK